MDYPILTPNRIDPVLFSSGHLTVRWYGLMYLLGFLFAFFLGKRWLLRNETRLSHWGVSDLEQFLLLNFMGLFLGGRLGYMLIYAWESLIKDPVQLFRIWEGGMSFHGGCLGVLITTACIAKQQSLPFLLLTDFLAPLVPIGLGLGRIGNFINAELVGRPTQLPWGIHFPAYELQPVPRHPSQLYEAILEGALLFALLIWKRRAAQSHLGLLSGKFCLYYGLFRFSVEFFREPDSSIGLIAGILSMGQLLSLPMIFIGVVLLFSTIPLQETSEPIPYSSDTYHE